MRLPQNALMSQHIRHTAALLSAFVWFCIFGLVSVPTFGQWQPAGPAPIENGLSPVGVEGLALPQQAGAIHAVAPHPWDAQILFAGSVTGGLFRTLDARSAQPNWSRVATDAPSGAIGALVFDYSDPFGKTLVAGVGSYSSLFRLNARRTGLLRTTDLGNSWTVIDGGGTLVGQDISGLHAHGPYLVASANELSQQPGVYFSADGGQTFTLVSVGDGSTTGLPAGIAYDLVSPKWVPHVVFTAIVNAEASGGVSGLYRSDNFGANWYRVSRPDLEATLSYEDFDPSDGDDEIKTTNVEIATGANGSVFTAIVNQVQDATGLGAPSRLDALFASNLWNPYFWQQLDVPNVNPGGQGSLHLSVAADPYDVNILYVGGDRQDGPFPNAIGANRPTGNLWRGNVTFPSGSQFVHLTHSNTLGAFGGGTASGSAPHADSRDIVFDAWGNLIQGDDGGIYAHTSPRTAFGDWYSLNGNLQATELKDATYDSNSQVAFGGSQDNANQYQSNPGATIWQALQGGDGGDTAVDLNLGAGISVRYTSTQNLGNLVFSVWDAAGQFLNAGASDLDVIDGGDPLQPQFYTPIEVNAVQGGRIVFGGLNGVYESYDLGESLLTVAPGLTVTASGIGPIAYGAANNPDALWFGTGSRVFVRDGVYPDPPVDAVTFPGRGIDLVISVELDPTDAATAFVATRTGVYQTTDYGTTWTDLTGNLSSLQTNLLFQAEYLDGATGDALVVGGFSGQLFIAHEASGFSQWAPIDSGLPAHTIIWDLDYDAASDTLIVGTVGQGAWRFDNIVDGP